MTTSKAATLVHSIDDVIAALISLRLQILAYDLNTNISTPLRSPPRALVLPKPRPREICRCTHGIEHHPDGGPCKYGHDTAFGGCPCPGWRPPGQRRTKATTKSETIEEKKRSLNGMNRPLVPQASPAEMKLLGALSQANVPMHRRKLALWTGYSPTSGGYGQALADLRADGYIEGPSEGIVITMEGRAFAGDVEPLPTGRKLLDWWLAKRPKSDGDVLLVLAEGRPMSRDAIADILGRSPTSGGFGQVLANLRKLGLIVGPSSAIRLAPELVG